MISGKVHPHPRRKVNAITGKPRVDLTVSSIFEPNRTLAITAVVDTGNTVHMTLRPEHIRQLALPRQTDRRAVLADGSAVYFPAYAGAILWDGQNRIIPIFEADTEPLLGMAMLWGSRLVIDAWEDGDVAIEAVQPP